MNFRNVTLNYILNYESLGKTVTCSLIYFSMFFSQPSSQSHLWPPILSLCQSPVTAHTPSRNPQSQSSHSTPHQQHAILSGKATQ